MPKGSDFQSKERQLNIFFKLSFIHETICFKIKIPRDFIPGQMMKNDYFNISLKLIMYILLFTICPGTKPQKKDKNVFLKQFFKYANSLQYEIKLKQKDSIAVPET